MDFRTFIVMKKFQALTYMVLEMIEDVEIDIRQDNKSKNVPTRKVTAISRKNVSGVCV